ncbi:MAG: hypothetical protein M3N38_09500, partial [Pseudomonadota bacterium]|nr:hypothetical protein [Pseudomonadota bacterium]
HDEDPAAGQDGRFDHAFELFHGALLLRGTMRRNLLSSHRHARTPVISLFLVMAGLDPAILYECRRNPEDGRVTPGHDDW